MLAADGLAADVVNSAPANTSDTIACMSQAPYGPGPAAPSSWPPQGPPPSSSGPSRLPTIIAIVIALIAIAVAIAAWFRPAPQAETPAAKTYSEQEIADAKKAVCDAYGQTQQTLKVTGSKASEDPTETFIIAINSRVAIETASSYLHSTVQSNQAAPKDVTEKVIRLADIYRGAVEATG